MPPIVMHTVMMREFVKNVPMVTPGEVLDGKYHALTKLSKLILSQSGKIVALGKKLLGDSAVLSIHKRGVSMIKAPAVRSKLRRKPFINLVTV